MKGLLLVLTLMITLSSCGQKHKSANAPFARMSCYKIHPAGSKDSSTWLYYYLLMYDEGGMVGGIIYYSCWSWTPLKTFSKATWLGSFDMPEELAHKQPVCVIPEPLSDLPRNVSFRIGPEEYPTAEPGGDAGPPLTPTRVIN